MTVKKSSLKILPLVMLTALLFLAGCTVSQSDYDVVETERDTARIQLNDAQSQITNLQGENSALQGENETLQGEIEVLEDQPVVGLPTIAEWIRSGKIDVGTADGLTLYKRFHTIHYKVLGLGCTSCHASEMTTQQEVFSDQDVSVAATAPVDRSGCVACHGVGGPATTLYGSEP